MIKAVIFASIAVPALAGFDFDCDIAETDDGGPGLSGFYCGGGKAGVPANQLAYCKCKKKDKCKTEYVRTCPRIEDEAGISRDCLRNSEKPASAACQKPVDPDKSICATSTGLPATGEGNYSKIEITRTCPKLGGINPYRLWKDFYDNTKYLKDQLSFLEDDVSWFELEYILKVANTTDGGFENKTMMMADTGGRAMWNAWEGLNNAGDRAATEYSCFRAYPACKRTGSAGAYTHQADIAECERECKEVNPFVDNVYTACQEALNGNGTQITSCTPYHQLHPEYVGPDNKRKCTEFCDTAPSSGASFGASVATLMALFAWSM